MTREALTGEEIEAIEKRADTRSIRTWEDVPRLVKALRAEREANAKLREELIRAHAPGVSVLAVDPQDDGAADIARRVNALCRECFGDPCECPRKST